MTVETKEQQQADKARVWAELGGEKAQADTPSTDTGAQADDRAADEATATDGAAQAAQEPAQETPPADDPYASLPPLIREELQGLKAINAQLQGQVRDAFGRIGGLNSQVQEMRRAASAAKAAGGEGPSEGELRAAQGSASKMAKLKEDYPEFGAALDEAIEERINSVRQKPASDVHESIVTAEQFEAYRREQSVEARHPGWKTIVSSPAFRGWLEAQPREVKLLASSDDPGDAIRLLDLRAAAAKKATQANRLETAAAIPLGRAGAAPRLKPDGEKSKAEIWAEMNQLERARA